MKLGFANLAKNLSLTWMSRLTKDEPRQPRNWSWIMSRLVQAMETLKLGFFVWTDKSHVLGVHDDGINLITPPFFPPAWHQWYGYGVLAGDWMIHSGAFSFMNDSFRTIQMLEWFIQGIQLLEWFIQADRQKSDFCSTRSSAIEYRLCTTSARATSETNRCPVKKSFRGIHFLEWFIQDHSSDWMIHSGSYLEKGCPYVVNVEAEKS